MVFDNLTLNQTLVHTFQLFCILVENKEAHLKMVLFSLTFFACPNYGDTLKICFE